MPIRLNLRDINGIRAEGEKAFPLECCGFLVGHMEPEKKVHHLQPVQNDRPDEQRHNRYTISPRDFMEGEKLARADGLDIIGFYHSHPNAPARPSVYDTEHAWPWYSYVIVSVNEGEADKVTSWVLDDDRSRFHPEELMVDE